MNKAKKTKGFMSLALVCAAGILTAFTSCTKKAEAAKSVEVQKNQTVETATISLGFSTNESDPRAIASGIFKEEVESKTGGRIKINIHPNGELGSDAELIEGVINGKVDMTVSSAGNFAVYATKLGISAMPFLFSTFEEAWAFMDGPLVSEVNKSLEEFGIVVLSHFDNGFRCVTTTKKPVTEVADMKGLNIRTPPNQIVMETMLALGANPKPYAFTELKKALKDGLFDSQENPIPVIYNAKLYEEQKYLAVTNHSYDAMPLVIRKELWDMFSAEDKQIILEAAKKAQDTDRQLVKEQTVGYVSKLQQAGMTVTSPNLKEFKKATADVMQVFTTIYGEDVLQKLKEATSK